MTGFHYTPYVIPLALSAAITVVILVVTWRNRHEPVAPWFAASLVALLVWTVGYMFELMAASVDAKIVWADLQYIGTTALPLLWLGVVLVYTGRGALPRAAWGALWALCAAIIVAIFINPAGLFRGQPSVVIHGSLTALAPDYGPLWRYVWVPWAYIILFVVILLLVRGMLHAQRIYARQYAALLVATVIPLAAGSLYTFGVSPWPDYNPAMAVVSISGVLMAYALFHYRLFDIAPLARDAVIDELADGLVVIDLEGRLRDFNRAARQVFANLGDDAVGRPVDEVLAIHPALLEGLRREAEVAPGGRAAPGSGLVRADVSVTSPTDGHLHSFTLHLTPVRRGSVVVGHALLLHDVSDNVELLDRLSELTALDELTGLLSRRAWRDEAEKEIKRARRYGYGLGLALLDLDQLAAANGRYGPGAGDALLHGVAAACRRCLRPFDVVGRVGSDEFAVLIPHLSPDETADVARRLVAVVGDLVLPHGDDELRITACAGVAAAETLDDETLSNLLHQVEGALQAAKRRGPGNVTCAWSG